MSLLCGHVSTVVPAFGVAHLLEPLSQARVSQLRQYFWVQEYVNGQLKNKYGDCFIRGNNGELLGSLLMLGV